MELSTNLRPILPSDLPTVEAWLRDFIAEHRAWWTDAYGAEPGTSLDDVVAAELEDLLGYAERDDHLVRILAPATSSDGAEGGTPMGIVYARIRTNRYMGFVTGVLGWIYVDPAGRGRGMASELMTAAEAWFVERNATGREVFVTAANPRAVGLYRRHGYQVVDYRMVNGG